MPDRLELLNDLADDLLTAGAEILGEVGLPVPDRRVIDVGRAPVPPLNIDGDCNDQLSVTCPGPTVARGPQFSPGVPIARGPCVLVWSATYTLTLFRCYEPSSLVLPSPEELTDAGRAHFRDGWQLARGLGARWAAGTLFPSYETDEPCSVCSLLDSVPIGPTGGVRGWAFPVQLLLDATYDGPT